MSLSDTKQAYTIADIFIPLFNVATITVNGCSIDQMSNVVFKKGEVYEIGVNSVGYMLFPKGTEGYMLVDKKRSAIVILSSLHMLEPDSFPLTSTFTVDKVESSEFSLMDLRVKPDSKNHKLEEVINTIKESACL